MKSAFTTITPAALEARETPQTTTVSAPAQVRSTEEHSELQLRSNNLNARERALRARELALDRREDNGSHRATFAAWSLWATVFGFSMIALCAIKNVQSKAVGAVLLSICISRASESLARIPYQKVQMSNEQPSGLHGTITEWQYKLAPPVMAFVAAVLASLFGTMVGAIKLKLA